MVEAAAEGTRVRCDISLIFHKCRVTVSEKQNLWVKFERAGKSFETKKISAEPGAKEYRFEKAG